MRWLDQLFSRRRRYDDLSESIREHLEEKIEDRWKMACLEKKRPGPLGENSATSHCWSGSGVELRQLHPRFCIDDLQFGRAVAFTRGALEGVRPPYGNCYSTGGVSDKILF
jgi:hypothetical protein